MSDKVKPKQIGRLTLEAVKNMSSGGNNSYNQVFDKNIQSMYQAGAMKTKVLEMPDLNMLDLSYDQIKALTDEELVKLLSGESHEGFIREPTIQLISNELLMRQIKEASKPHWTTVPAFILLIVTLILTTLTSLKPISDFYSEVFNGKNDHTNNGEQIKENSKP
ncbi:hypothetical protein Q5X42_04965 [Acinetobacter baumannii]|uniref:hypothetical protein n=1 Tax=Acinetobacter baumannii TaxID=470 RepID=UPI0002CFF333|nr:hypothetical protein [Acinetobacter baumannii]ENW64839.1 hypothetical protein F914_00738 [Acinetobacter baumannii NIPH 290]MDO7393279.1 hypothetical protein [Acinetobacter baumannii]HDX6144228.1 hypothetical protein [Acinetobacter baumannii]